MWAMKRQVCNTHQNNLDLTQYLGKIHANIIITEHMGCDIWVYSKAVDLKLKGNDLKDQ